MGQVQRRRSDPEPMRERREDPAEPKRAINLQKMTFKGKREYSKPSSERSLYDIATDDDAMAISCLQHLSRSIPKLIPERPPADNSVSSAQNRRTRVPMACTRCKMAHTRCDTKRPCGRCVRRGVADSCVDAIPKRRGRKRSDDLEAPLGRSIRPRV